MYNIIEKEFIKKSNFVKLQNHLLIFYIVFGVLYFLPLIITKNNNLLFLLYICVLLIMFLFSFYLYLYFKLKKNSKKLKFFAIKTNINELKQYIHDSEIKAMKEILLKNKIYRTDKIKEIIEHYRILLPRNIVKGTDILAWISFIISIVALFSTDIVGNNFTSLNIKLIFILAGILILIIFYFIGKTIKLLNNKESLYIRIESILSEIYIEKI